MSQSDSHRCRASRSSWSRYVRIAAPSGCLPGRKNCDAINGCPQAGASIDSLLMVTDRISCFK